MKKLKEFKTQFDQEGCLVIPEFFSDSELAVIFPIIERIHQKWLEINREDYLLHKMINSNYLTQKDYLDPAIPEQRTALFNFIGNSRLVDLVSCIIEDKISFLGAQIFFNPKDHSKAGYWHRDTQYTGLSIEDQKKAMLEEPVIHCHIPFIDDEAFELIPGSHKRWDNELEFNTRMNLKDHKNSDSLDQAINYKCRRGDLRLFSAHAIHRGINYGPTPERFIFDALFIIKSKSTKKYLNQKAMPERAELRWIDNAEIYEI